METPIIAAECRRAAQAAENGRTDGEEVSRETKDAGAATSPQDWRRTPQQRAEQERQRKELAEHRQRTSLAIFGKELSALRFEERKVLPPLCVKPYGCHSFCAECRYAEWCRRDPAGRTRETEP